MDKISLYIIRGIIVVVCILLVAWWEAYGFLLALVLIVGTIFMPRPFKPDFNNRRKAKGGRIWY